MFLIKGSCEQLMDECFLLPLFQNKSLCETLHKKMNLNYEPVGGSHMNGFAISFILT